MLSLNNGLGELPEVGDVRGLSEVVHGLVSVGRDGPKERVPVAPVLALRHLERLRPGVPSFA